ncbi:LysR family transcriptional regulator [Ciceribacter sp. RN22]|uniref:LysR family transcriptional regulator n=1 Tax=Ciceribacter sp. RN22 TaxID=2954932 RepID=UPI002092AEF0|nr:LysR family transcriptional regulator [Ciceribacter sp. RN22]MCO6179597.1 LysR family transcriptional regulator [Ciceribacter sp. RN22]
MRLDRFDLNLLVVLDVLLEERNVTRAAERLHIGQSATSAALARLRDYFGDSLMVQVGRRMELTPLAQSLMAPVRDALMRARSAIAMRPTFEPASIGRTFSVAASDYMLDVLLARVVRDLASSAPGMRLDIRRTPHDVLEAFERGAVDLLIIPEQYAGKLQHPQVQVLEDEHVCMMCADAAKDMADLTLDHYFERGHVSIRLGDERSLAFEEWFLPRYGRQRRVECTVDQFSVAPLLVIGTDRIVTMHRRMAEEMAQRFPVKLFNAPFEMQPLKEVMVWHRYLDEDLAHRWLRDAILSVADRQHHSERLSAICHQEDTASPG